MASYLLLLNFLLSNSAYEIYFFALKLSINCATYPAAMSLHPKPMANPTPIAKAAKIAWNKKWITDVSI